MLYSSKVKAHLLLHLTTIKDILQLFFRFIINLMSRKWIFPSHPLKYRMHNTMHIFMHPPDVTALLVMCRIFRSTCSEEDHQCGPSMNLTMRKAVLRWQDSEITQCIWNFQQWELCCLLEFKFGDYIFRSRSYNYLQIRERCIALLYTY